MIAMIAPARNVRLLPAGAAPLPATSPLFMQDTMQLVKALRQYSPWQLESLLDVPPERAFRLYDAYQNFGPEAGGSPALLAYYGAAYRNMAPHSFTPAQLQFAQRHLRIMSALYGMLRPLDAVLEHRLGLKKDFSPGGKDLYAFWAGKLYAKLFAEGDVVVNLASQEYARLVTPHMQPGDTMVNCRFLVEKPGGAKGTVATVRAARGLMAGFMVRGGITSPEGLKAFDEDGYQFAPARSTSREYVFVKRKMAAGQV